MTGLRGGCTGCRGADGVLPKASKIQKERHLLSADVSLLRRDGQNRYFKISKRYRRPTPPAFWPAALCAVQAFCRRQNLGAGGIYFRRAGKFKGAPHNEKHCAGKFCGGCFTGKYPIDVWRKPQRAARESGLDAGAACMCAPPWKRADDQTPAFAVGLCKSCIKDGRLWRLSLIFATKMRNPSQMP